MFKITQWFGERPEYYSQFGLPSHEGIDVRAPNGTPLYAVKSGAVYLATTNQGNYGIQVRIQHEQGYQTIYAHMLSVAVTVGQFVNGGDIIGYADNTGNSDADHLHFSEKQQNVTYTDQKGTVWPFNFRDPWPHLKPLYQNWLNQNSIIGYLYAPSLVLNMEGEYARCLGTLNIRQQANSTSPILGQTKYATVVQILSPLNNGYYQVQTPVDIPINQPGYQYNGPQVSFRPVIESPADDWRWITVKPMIDSLGIGVKFKSHGVNANYYNAYDRYDFRPIRLFHTFNNYVSPAILYQDTWCGEINKFYSQGARDFELGNEPNLSSEGNGIFWTNGAEYANYMKQVCQFIKTDFPQIRLWFTAMSPGVPFTNQYVWTDQAWPILKLFCYGFCLHAYSGNNSNVQTAVNEIVTQIDTTRQRYNLQVPLFVSECSVNRGTNYQQKAQVYKQLETVLRNKAGIRGLSYFVSDWFSPPPEQVGHGESWYGTSLPQFYLT